MSDHGDATSQLSDEVEVVVESVGETVYHDPETVEMSGVDDGTSRSIPIIPHTHPSARSDRGEEDTDESSMFSRPPPSPTSLIANQKVEINFLRERLEEMGKRLAQRPPEHRSSGLGYRSMTAQRGFGQFEENGWTFESCQTVDQWKDECLMTWKTYNHVRKWFKRQAWMIALLLMILQMIRGLVDVAKVAVGEDSDVGTAIEYVNLGFSAIGIFLTTYRREFDLEAKIETLTGYISRVRSFLAALVSESTTPKELRKEADKFIIQQKETFFQLMDERPDDIYTFESAYQKLADDPVAGPKLATEAQTLRQRASAYDN